MTDAVTKDDALPTKLDPRHKVILAVLLISTFVVFLNETILGVALPEIMAQLQIPASTGQWLNTAYMLTMAVIIRGAVPFLCLQAVGVTLCIIFPGLVLWLPRLLIGYGG